MANRTYSVDEDVVQLLERVGNKSEYLCAVIRERWREWQEALGLLFAAGWRGRELLAACDALNGYYHAAGLDYSDAVTGYLTDAAALTDLCEKWGIAPARWAALCALISADGTGNFGRAMLTVAREFWTGNKACAGAIRRSGAPTKLRPPGDKSRGE